MRHRIRLLRRGPQRVSLPRQNSATFVPHQVKQLAVCDNDAALKQYLRYINEAQAVDDIKPSHMDEMSPVQRQRVRDLVDKMFDAATMLKVKYDIRFERVG